MEFMCPVCGKWTEIHEHQVFAGNRCRCRRCGGLLRITSTRPFSIVVEDSLNGPPVRIGSGAGAKEEEHGQDHLP